MQEADHVTRGVLRALVLEQRLHFALNELVHAPTTIGMYCLYVVGTTSTNKINKNTCLFSDKFPFSTS